MSIERNRSEWGGKGEKGGTGGRGKRENCGQGVVPKWGRISRCSVSGASEMMGWRWENLNRSQPSDGRRSVLGDVMCHRRNQTNKSLHLLLSHYASSESWKQLFLGLRGL